jgi:hypothetical protein
MSAILFRRPGLGAALATIATPAFAAGALEGERASRCRAIRRSSCSSPSCC